MEGPGLRASHNIIDEHLRFLLKISPIKIRRKSYIFWKIFAMIIPAKNLKMDKFSRGSSSHG